MRLEDSADRNALEMRRLQCIQGLTSNEGSTVVDEHGFDLRHDHRRQDDDPEDCEDAELEFPHAIPKLQE